MNTFVVHDAVGNVVSVVVQDAEIEGELEIVAGDDEYVLELSAADLAQGADQDDPEGLVEALRAGEFRVDPSSRSLVPTPKD